MSYYCPKCNYSLEVYSDDWRSFKAHVTVLPSILNSMQANWDPNTLRPTNLRKCDNPDTAHFGFVCAHCDKPVVLREEPQADGFVVRCVHCNKKNMVREPNHLLGYKH